MSAIDYYYYDKQENEYVRVDNNELNRVVYTVSTWMLFGVLVAGIGLSIFSFSIGTPAEIALKSENKALKEQLLATQTTINSLNNQVDQLAQTDNSLYRSMLVMNKNSIYKRKGGFGVDDMYLEFDISIDTTAA